VLLLLLSAPGLAFQDIAGNGSFVRCGFALRITLSPWCCAVRWSRLQVKTLTGKEIEIDIEPNDTVQRIKERVEEKEGIPPVQQR
jgi:hypothetical protein